MYSGPSVGIFRIVLGLPVLTLIAALGGCGWMLASGPAATDILLGQRDRGVSTTDRQGHHESHRRSVRNRPRLAAFGKKYSTAGCHIRRRRCRERHDLRSRFWRPLHSGRRRRAAGLFVTIPNEAVDIHGNISIPYAGSVRARGRTQIEVQDAIVAALNNRAIEPQVVVSTVGRRRP